MKRLLITALLASASACFARLSPLATAPDWSKLKAYEGTITREEFVSLLDKVYAPGGAWKETIAIDENSARITTRPGQPPFLLTFASSRSGAKAIPSYWRTRRMLPTVEPGKPLAGLKIAIDPGHLGGYWAKMEERWFQIGNSKPVTEGDMTLYVAKLLVPRLQALGAEVFLTRSRSAPVTSLRPGGLKKAATASLEDKGSTITDFSLQKEAERLFYRVGEIRRRGTLVNEKIRPDIVLCLHFNAEEWGDAAKPRLVEANHLHFLVSGALSRDEMDYEDQRYEMLLKLLNRSHTEELALTDVMSRKMADATGLPPYRYESNSAIHVNGNPYVWARNLLANRVFICPVIYVEPYVMNSKLVFARIQAGDYEGRKNFGGMMRKSIFREYADAIVDGLVAYYSKRPL